MELIAAKRTLDNLNNYERKPIMMIKPADNLFNVVAGALASGELSELYMIAGQEFDLINAPDAVRLAAVKAQEQLAGSNAISVLAAHYQLCEGALSSAFADGCYGLIQNNGIAVEFNIHKTCKTPEMWRVLFTRVRCQAPRS